MRWWQVYVGCFAVVVLGAYPSLPVGVRNWDNIVKIQAATNFLAGKGFVITEPTPDDPTYLRLGRDGRAFTMYAPMAYVQQFPVLAMARLTGTPQEGVAPLVFLGLAAVMLVAAGRRNGANPAAATAGALMVCFGTALWASVTHGYDVLVEVFALSVILWAAKADDHVLNWLAPGLALGAALATRQSAALLLAPAAVVLLQTPRTRLFRRALIFTGGLLPWVLLILWFNWYRFGSPLGASGGGYLAGGMQISIAPWFSTVHLEGMAGLVVSPGKGVIWYGPPLLGVVAFIRPLWRRYRSLYVPLAAYAIVAVVGLGKLSFWAGEWAWGPRYVAPLYVAAAPLVWWLWERAAKLAPPARIAACAGAMLLIAVEALPAVGLPIDNHFDLTMKELTAQHALATSPMTRPPEAADNRVLYFEWKNSMMVSLSRSLLVKLNDDRRRAKLLALLAAPMIVPSLALAWVWALVVLPGGNEPSTSAAPIATKAQPALEKKPRRRRREG